MAETRRGPQDEGRARASEREKHGAVTPGAGLPTLPVTYRNLWFVLPQAACCLFMAVTGPLGFVFPYQGEKLDFWLTMFVGLLTLGSVAVLIRCPRLGLTVTEGGLIARDWLRTEFVPWSDVKAFRVEEIETTTPCGPMLHWMIAIHVPPAGSVMLETLQGKRYVKRVCPELERLRTRLGSTRSSFPSTHNRNLLDKPRRRVPILDRLVDRNLRNLQRKQSSSAPSP